MARVPSSVSQPEAGSMKSLPSRFARILIVILPFRIGLKEAKASPVECQLWLGNFGLYCLQEFQADGKMGKPEGLPLLQSY
jgi:hypothetical protein